MKSLWRPACALAFAGIMLGVLYAQRPFRVYPSVEGYDTMPLPPDGQRSAEWTFARLMYPPGPLDGYYPRFQGDWRKGLSLWTQDYPRADRALSAAIGRLTRVDARSVEQPVNLDDGDEVYLLRGGFFMADDFHGSEEQAYFEKTMKMVFPDRPIVDIPNDDPIFHTVFDLDARYQVPGAEHLSTGYKKDGRVARWRGIYDDKGHIMVAISQNSDLGDSWEWLNNPRYPLKFSDLGIRIGVNYVVYAMTH